MYIQFTQIMQQLKAELLDKGFTEVQVMASFLVIQEWLQDHYPVAGTLMGAYLSELSGHQANRAIEPAELG